MVTRSIENWKKHKNDVFNKLKNDYGLDRATKFINHYSTRYDKFGRNFLSYKAAFSFFDDYNFVKNVGTRWFAFVGIGGSGKTTLMENVFYFFDDSFKVNRLNLEFESFIDDIRAFSKVNAFKSTGLDEPDDTFHPQSKQGLLFRSVLGKARQQNLFLGINATDLNDIPPSIYKKLNVIVFLPYAGKAVIFKDRPLKRIYIIQKIRKEYTEMGYKSFFNNYKYGLKIDTYAASPFNKRQKTAYKKQKAKDYDETIERLYKSVKVSKKGEGTQDPINRLILQKRKKGFSYNKIGEDLELSKTAIFYRIKKLKQERPNLTYL